MNVAWDFFFVSCTELLLFFFSHEYIHYALYWPRFEEQEVPGSRSFFTEIIASISDIKFAKDGRYILSRDYMTLKVDFFFIYVWYLFLNLSTLFQYGLRCCFIVYITLCWLIF